MSLHLAFFLDTLKIITALDGLLLFKIHIHRCSGKQLCIHFQTGYVLYLLEWVSGEEAMVFCLPKLHASYN